MSNSYWRNRAAPIIADTIERVGLDDKKALRKALREAYPFHARKHWPYKIWLDEIKRQTNQKSTLYKSKAKHAKSAESTGYLFEPES
jgi:hypothetical protein